MNQWVGGPDGRPDGLRREGRLPAIESDLPTGAMGRSSYGGSINFVNQCLGRFDLSEPF